MASFVQAIIRAGWFPASLLLLVPPGYADFSHRVHVAQKIDCLVCHSSAISSKAASDNLLPNGDPGSFSVDAAGPNLLWTARENLANFPDVPEISYTTGHVTFAVDASGQTTSYTLAGRRTDVCAVLAP